MWKQLSVTWRNRRERNLLVQELRILKDFQIAYMSKWFLMVLSLSLKSGWPTRVNERGFFPTLCQLAWRQSIKCIWFKMWQHHWKNISPILKQLHWLPASLFPSFWLGPLWPKRYISVALHLYLGTPSVSWPLSTASSLTGYCWLSCGSNGLWINCFGIQMLGISCCLRNSLCYSGCLLNWEGPVRGTYSAHKVRVA